jgi:hypothetical protein
VHEGDIGAFADVVLEGGEVVVACFFVVEEIPYELGVFLQCLLAIVRVCVEDQALAEVFRHFGAVAGDLHDCVVFVLVDSHQVVGLVAAVIFLGGWLHDHPAELTRGGLALKLELGLGCCQLRQYA